MSIELRPSAPAFDGVLRMLTSSGRAAAVWLRDLGVSLVRRKMVADLGRMDDRMLADVGLTRSDLRAAAEWSLWADPTDRLAALAEERRAARPPRS